MVTLIRNYLHKRDDLRFKSSEDQKQAESHLSNALYAWFFVSVFLSYFWLNSHPIISRKSHRSIYEDETAILIFCTVIFFLLMKFFNSKFRSLPWASKSRIALVTIFLVSIASLSSTVIINSSLDFSRPEERIAYISDRRSGSDRNKFYYYLYLLDWRFRGDKVRVDVRGPIYESCIAKNRIRLTTKKGVLNREWIVKIHGCM